MTKSIIPRPLRGTKQVPSRAGTARRAIAGLVRDRRGATIIEFALVAAPFIALLIAILETSTTFLAQQALETSAEASARQLMTGQAQTNNTDAAGFRAGACKTLPAFMKCANLFVEVRSSTDWSNTDMSVPKITYDSNGNISNKWQYDPGSVGSIIIMRLFYVWPVVPGPLGFNLANMPNNRRLLIATSVFKTEPYAGVSS